MRPDSHAATWAVRKCTDDVMKTCRTPDGRFSDNRNVACCRRVLLICMHFCFLNPKSYQTTFTSPLEYFVGWKTALDVNPGCAGKQKSRGLFSFFSSFCFSALTVWEHFKRGALASATSSAGFVRLWVCPKVSRSHGSLHVYSSLNGGPWVGFMLINKLHELASNLRSICIH